MITTYGDHAAGFQAQSGGGGKGGAAISFVGGLLPTVAVGVGGPARDVYITNGAQVTTYGPDAPGVLMQSIGVFNLPNVSAGPPRQAAQPLGPMLQPASANIWDTLGLGPR